MDEMENCDCMGSDDYEDEQLPLDYDDESAGTLSDGSGHEMGWVHDDDEDEYYEDEEELCGRFHKLQVTLSLLVIKRGFKSI
ncbi:hypothetical protein FRC17_002208 [Serendipita sp. 399]|nr:hypothetical protein FRC17_002208 [Serendipita sp. 399]